MRIALLSTLVLLAFALPAEASMATFRCALGVDIQVSYSADGAKATVRVQGRRFTLPAASAGSGARYSDGETTLWEHQGEARFETPGLSLSGCKLVGPM